MIQNQTSHTFLTFVDLKTRKTGSRVETLVVENYMLLFVTSKIEGLTNWGNCIGRLYVYWFIVQFITLLFVGGGTCAFNK